MTTSSNGSDGWRRCGAWLVAYAALWLLATPPANVWIAAYIAIAPLTWAAWRSASPLRAGLLTWAVAWLVFLWLTSWTIPVTALGYPLFALAVAFYPGLYAWGVRSLRDWTPTARLPMTIIAPTLWVATELLRGNLVVGGFPWHMLGHPVVETPVMAQSADLFGGYWLSAVAAMTAGLLVDLLRFGRGEMSRARLLGAATGAIAILGANLGYGLWRLGQTAPLAEGPLVLAMQTNLPQSNKNTDTWEQKIAFFQKTLEDTTQAILDTSMEQGAAPDLVVWPETMLPGFGIDRETLFMLEEEGFLAPVDIALLVVREANRTDTPWLVGSQAYEGLRVTDERFVWDRNYNAAYLVHPDRSIQRYAKVELTPFGETMPVISNWEWLEQRLLALGAGGMPFNLDAADTPELLTLRREGGTRAIGTPICYEASTPWVMRAMANADDGAMAFFVNPSNDGWFGDDEGWFGESQGPRERLVQALRIRCIENRRSMVRSVNTGLSVAIDSRGMVVATIGSGRYGQMNVAGRLATRVTLDGRVAPYRRLGDSFAYLLLGVAMLAVGASRIGGRRRSIEASPNESDDRPDGAG